MQPGLKAFMSEILDYAGLFPPAKLPFEAAFPQYLSLLKDKDSWMLGRFICPSGDVEKMSDFREEINETDAPIRISLLIRENWNFTEIPAKLVNEISGSLHTLQRLEIPARIEMVECRLSAEGQSDWTIDSIPEVMDQTITAWSTENLMPASLFLEVERTDSWPKNIELLMKGLSNWRRKSPEHPLNTGFKMRCGGEEASAFPTVEEAAIAIHTCAENQIPFKATAGLHHPVRHFNKQVATMMHGFFNIFGAALLAFRYRLPWTELVKIISDEDPGNFRFEENVFQWKNLKINTDEMTELRTHRVISFGSCSFEEPREDLKSMKLL